MKVLFIFIVLLTTSAVASPGCVGRMINPVTDVCWKCLFPMHIAGFKVVKSSMADRKPSVKAPICFCKKPPIPIPMPGIPIAFWEPVRLVDVTKSPMCMVSLGGINLGSSQQRGMKDDQDGSAFYQVHWYIYPVIYWLELLVDFVCLDNLAIDVAYLTEFDPMWGDDTKSAIINPEAILFGSKIAQGACIADCMTSTVPKSTPIDSLFWCCGCQGSMYPYTGTMTGYNGGVQASTLLVSRMIAKLHREFLLWATWGKPMVTNRCSKYPKPLIDKSAYRLQMTFPIAETKQCRKIGETEVAWQSGKEFPVKGEDFAYLIWHKRECCLGAI